MVLKTSTYCVTFYSLIGVLGYISTFDKTPEIFVTRVAPWGKDYAMVIAQIMVTLALCANTLLSYMPFRSSVLNLTLGDTTITFRRYSLAINL